MESVRISGIRLEIEGVSGGMSEAVAGKVMAELQASQINEEQ